MLRLSGRSESRNAKEPGTPRRRLEPSSMSFILKFDYEKKSSHNV